MGRIKTKLIKAKTREMLESFGERFSEDFVKNKTVLNEVALWRSKKMRNAIAGYLVRMKQAELRISS